MVFLKFHIFSLKLNIFIHPKVLSGYNSTIKWSLYKSKWLSVDVHAEELNRYIHAKKLSGHVHKEWCWRWNSNTLATWYKELTHLKRPWFCERLRVEGEGDDRGWDGWMASLTEWTWVWVNSGSWWWTGRPGVLQFMGSQRVRHDWATELNWTEHLFYFVNVCVNFWHSNSPVRMRKS